MVSHPYKQWNHGSDFTNIKSIILDTVNWGAKSLSVCYNSPWTRCFKTVFTQGSITAEATSFQIFSPSWINLKFFAGSWEQRSKHWMANFIGSYKENQINTFWNKCSFILYWYPPPPTNFSRCHHNVFISHSCLFISIHFLTLNNKKGKKLVHK